VKEADEMALTVLVAGATGRFRPVAELLLERGHRVRAGTRDPRSSAAEELAALGAELVDFDFDDTASIEAAAHGVDAVFASGTAHRAGPEGEVRHGRNLADALSAARVGHVVYSSGAGADQRTGVPVFEGKRQVEEYLNALRLPATILAPVYLMENLFNPWNVPALAAGVFPSPVPARRAIQQVPIVDVAAFSVHALERRDDFLRQRVELASDSLNGLEEAGIISSVSGRELAMREVSSGGALQVLFDWLDRVGFAVDIGALHRDYPDVPWHSFSEWAFEQDWTVLSGPAPAADLAGCATPR
jgi:uncharacterized protein YbjT (DUF2867 family)